MAISDSIITHTLIDQPANIAQDFKRQMIDLVVAGGQIKRHFVKDGIERAYLIGMALKENEVMAVCSLKRPLQNYIKSVFNKAGVPELHENYDLELGYIATKSGFEGRGLCQKLLAAFMPKISGKTVFATTRKAAMEHILSRYDFKQSGDVYDQDLKLMTSVIPELQSGY